MFVRSGFRFRGCLRCRSESGAQVSGSALCAQRRRRLRCVALPSCRTHGSPPFSFPLLSSGPPWCAAAVWAASSRALAPRLCCCSVVVTCVSEQVDARRRCDTAGAARPFSALHGGAMQRGCAPHQQERRQHGQGQHTHGKAAHRPPNTQRSARRSAGRKTGASLKAEKSLQTNHVEHIQGGRQQYCQIKTMFHK